jgi:hypothetical protein
VQGEGVVAAVLMLVVVVRASVLVVQLEVVVAVAPVQVAGWVLEGCLPQAHQ